MISAINNEKTLYLTNKQFSSNIYSATVVVPADFVDTIYNQASFAQQACIEAQGFRKGTVPLEYIHKNYQTTLLEHVKEFLFNFFVVSFLHKELRESKILMAGEPRLINIHAMPGEDASFTFEVDTFASIDIHDWRYLPFKAAKRKRYKDLDRQVDMFVDEEKARLKKHTSNAIEIGDWVNFEISLLDNNKCSLLGTYKENLWLKMGDEEIDRPLRELFLGKKVGETFCTTSDELQTFFSDHIAMQYTFCITILDNVCNSYFCSELFKRCFKIKTNKEMYRKLIEVFSYRNDLSQRRSTAEAAIKLLLSKHRIDISENLIEHQQKLVLIALQSNPDYHVYRTQKDFRLRVQQLAEKQSRECILLDQMAFRENITVSHEDIAQYLNLIKRQRTKEFVYFEPPLTKIHGQEIPISTEELKNSCLREKTLNHIIYHLTKA